MKLRLSGSDTRKCLDQQIASLLLMNARHEKQKAMISRLRAGREENLFLSFGIAARTICSIRYDNAIPLVGAEAHECLFFFCLRGKQHGQRVSQDRILKWTPVQNFFQVLERVCLLKPWIERSMNKHRIGHFIPDRAPRCKAVILPDSIDHDSVVALHVLSQPR